MAYILEINEWIIVTKTNVKPMKNRSKTNLKMKRKCIVKLHFCKLESEWSRSMTI